MLKPDASCRTASIEVATQNSGLAAWMATQFFTPEAALPGAVATIYANISGVIYAAIVRLGAVGKGSKSKSALMWKRITASFVKRSPK
nr:hypothetical protein [Corynebacterium diphtheriae]